MHLESELGVHDQYVGVSPHAMERVLAESMIHFFPVRLSREKPAITIWIQITNNRSTKKLDEREQTHEQSFKLRISNIEDERRDISFKVQISCISSELRKYFQRILRIKKVFLRLFGLVFSLARNAAQ